MMLKRFAILLFMLAAARASHAACPEPEQPQTVQHTIVQYHPSADTLAARTPSRAVRSDERNRRLYDSIRTKAGRHRFPRMLYNILFTDPERTNTNKTLDVDEGLELHRYDGRTIGRITIQRDEVFGHRHTIAARIGNKIHVLTAESAIRRDLMLHEGRTFDAGTLMRNRQLLQSRPYISEARIEVRPDSTDSMTVDLLVRTRDSWTIGADGALRSRGRSTLELYDANLLGTGNRLTIGTNIHRPSFAYGGNTVAYEIPNLLGSFLQARASAGRSFTESELCFDLRHDFIAPTDFEAGVSFDRLHSDYPLGIPDTTVSARLRSWHVWGGHSTYLPRISSSIYATAHYANTLFGSRPDVSHQSNPAFHSYELLLAGIGLYRENFGTTTYVDGMGVGEYFATGYKAELTGGHRWGEFGNDIYIGVEASAGAFLRQSYLAGGVSMGSFIDPHTGRLRQSAVRAEAGWFSGLHRAAGHCLVRYYVSARYTAGWNRMNGYREYIGFTRTTNVRLLDRSGLYGTNRLTLNTQAVIFTPLQPLGFRFAVVVFTDLGLLGRDSNIFRNTFYNTLGIGLRIRNDRLIFGTINLRAGFAWGRQGILPNRWFEMSSGSPVLQMRYKPSRPEPVAFE